MPRKITVVATNHPVPFERDPKRTIGSTPLAVENTSYIQRRILAGELRVVEAAPVPKEG